MLKACRDQYTTASSTGFADDSVDHRVSCGRDISMHTFPSLLQSHYVVKVGSNRSRSEYMKTTAE